MSHPHAHAHRCRCGAAPPVRCTPTCLVTSPLSRLRTSARSSCCRCGACGTHQQSATGKQRHCSRCTVCVPAHSLRCCCSCCCSPQDYLHQARNPSSGPASRSAFHFRFFLRSDSGTAPPTAHTDTDASDADAPDASAPDAAFQLAALSLPPPQPGNAAGQLSGPAFRGLQKLLALCGLPPLADEASEQAADASARLTSFLPQAAEVCAHCTHEWQQL